MKCPLMVKEVYATEEGIKALVADCIKEECAWWDVTDQLCCLRTLAKSAYFIHKGLYNLGWTET